MKLSIVRGATIVVVNSVLAVVLARKTCKDTTEQQKPETPLASINVTTSVCVHVHCLVAMVTAYQYCVYFAVHTHIIIGGECGHILFL